MDFPRRTDTISSSSGSSTLTANTSKTGSFTDDRLSDPALIRYANEQRELDSRGRKVVHLQPSGPATGAAAIADAAVNPPSTTIGSNFFYIFDTYRRVLKDCVGYQQLFNKFLAPSTVIRVQHRMAKMLFTYNGGRDFQYSVLTLSANQVPTSLHVGQRLGYLVKNVASTCPQGGRDACELWCAICSACCHLYACNCRRRGKYRGWCVHIHAALKCGIQLFDETNAVFVHVSRRQMKLAHLRGMCYAHPQKPLPAASFEADVTYNVVKREQDECTDETCSWFDKCPVCRICRHLYECDCSWYEKRGFLCEHCHALRRTATGTESSGSEDLLRKFDEIPAPSDADDEKLERNFSFLHSHERSYGIADSRISYTHQPNEEVYTVNKSDISSEKEDVINVKVMDDSCVRFWDYPDDENLCSYCLMSGNQYECSCTTCSRSSNEANFNCEYKHAVHRRRFSKYFENSEAEWTDSDEER